MIKWMHQFSEASFQTKMFVITAILFGALLIATTIYCYGRIEWAHQQQSANTVKTTNAA